MPVACAICLSALPRAQGYNGAMDGATPHHWERCIIHADMDAFYAAVEQREDPSLQGKPVLVGGRPEGRGVVAACSYEARRYGIHSAMPMHTAITRCPHARVVSPRFDLYSSVSDQVMDIFRSLTRLVQPLSLDEAFLDVSQVACRQDPAEVAVFIKGEVKQRLSLIVSVGVATSMSVAKVASDMEKPDGLVVVHPGNEREFLAPLPVRRLPGIGPKAEALLTELGVATIGDLAASDEDWALSLFGKRGPELRLLAQGQDDRPVITERPAKSVSAENTFSSDLYTSEALHRELRSLCQRVADRLQASQASGRTVTLKLRLADFTTFTRSATLPVAISDYEELATAAIKIMDQETHSGRSFRLLGVGVSNFVEARQLPLL